MKTTQEIFTLALTLGLYGEEYDHEKGIDNLVETNGVWTQACNFMCGAVTSLMDCGQISYDEAQRVKDEIDEYIKPYAFLSSALHANSLPNSLDDRKAIYADWANRPKLEV